MVLDKHDLSSDVETDGPLNQHKSHGGQQGGKPTATVRPANGTESRRRDERGMKEVVGDMSNKKKIVNIYI